MSSILKYMDLSGIKLVVADMDGTLLNSRHKVSPQFYELYSGLKEKGVLFAAASGRQYDSIADKLSPISHEIIVIAENGGYVIHQGEELVSNPLEAHQKNMILDHLEPVQGAHPVLCGKHSAYLLPGSKTILEKLIEYYTHFKFLDDMRAFQGDVMKIAVYHEMGSEEHIYPYVRHLEGDLKVKVSGEFWVDLSHLDAHKGFALNRIQNKLGISQAETLVFGDYNNDLEMLSLAHYSFAMANAHPNVLQAANYQTLSNDEYGVEKVLEKLLLSKS